MNKLLVIEDDATTRHLLTRVLRAGGFSVSSASDGAAGLKRLRKGAFDLVLLDIWMPRMDGLEVLARMRSDGVQTKAIVMTSDDTPETLLRAVRDHAYQYTNKPVQPDKLVRLVRDALAATEAPPIEVLSARPEWVELLVPCEMGAAERIQDFMHRLDADLPAEVRESTGFVFHEMLMNAIEWGGKLDPNSKVRISYVRARRMVLYRIADPGPGFRFEELSHAAVAYESDKAGDSAIVRQEKGLRAGGFGILLAREMVDELLYNEAQNEVLFVKYLG
jgi:CheY-like chemotaxis protein/anti-sigma regulatory factor (Ser/Thr protein kinase)